MFKTTKIQVVVDENSTYALRYLLIALRVICLAILVLYMVFSLLIQTAFLLENQINDY